MIDQLTGLFNVATAAKDFAAKHTGLKDDEISTAASFFQKARSISAAASKYVIEYPVAVSEQITDYKTALAITKQVELECARFIILTSGLNPVVDTTNKDTIDAHINGLMTSFECYKGVKLRLTPPTLEQQMGAEEYMRTSYSTEEYQSFKPSVFSREMVDADAAKDPEDDETEAIKAAEKDINSKADTSIASKPDEKGKDKLLTLNETNIVTYNKITQDLSKVGPTIVNIKLILTTKGDTREVSVPLAIKASLQYLDSESIKRIIENTSSVSKKLFNWIKFTTGQISFFKDFLLKMDDVKHDVEEERKLGQYPFYRRLLDAKNRYRIKTIAGGFGDKIKNIVNHKTQKDMPMCTIVLTSDELTEATKLRFNYLLNNKKYINEIMDYYMLLCLGVVDNVNDVIYFFSGVENPEIISISEAGKTGGNKDSNNAEKIIDNLVKMMMRK